MEHTPHQRLVVTNEPDSLDQYRGGTKAERHTVMCWLHANGYEDAAEAIGRAQHVPAGEGFDFVRNLSDVVTPDEAEKGVRGL